jgi:hypothetical protein
LALLALLLALVLLVLLVVVLGSRWREKIVPCLTFFPLLPTKGSSSSSSSSRVGVIITPNIPILGVKISPSSWQQQHLQPITNTR